VRLVVYLNRNLFIVSGPSLLNSHASEKEMAEQARASGLISSWGGWSGSFSYTFFIRCVNTWL